MKIDNDTSTLFVKQDLFANPSAKKASNATGKELDNVLIVDRNRTDRDIFGNSYDVKLDSNSINSTHGIIDINGDYDPLAKSNTTKDDTISDIELRIQNALSSSSSQNDEVYAFEIKRLGFALNNYMKIQNDDYDAKQDTYIQSLKDRFDSLDPDHQDTRINLIRNMIDTVQSGNVIHIKDDEFARQIKASAIDQTTTLPANTKKNSSTYNDNDILNSRQIQAYKVSMIQSHNNASLLSKLLNIDTVQSDTSTFDITSFIFNDKDNDSSLKMRDKLRKLANENNYSNIDNTQADANDNNMNSKSTITATDWNKLTKNYAIEHKKDMPVLLKACEFNSFHYNIQY